MKNQAQLTIASKSKNIGLARITVSTFASELDFTLNELEEIKVAVSEAVTNSVIHGYAHSRGNIVMEMEIENEQLKVVVTDYGVGISDLEAVLEPSYSTKEEHMGLGFAFIESFMDDFEVESEEGKGTSVYMTKIPERKNRAENQGG